MSEWDELSTERDFDGAIAQLGERTGVGSAGIVGHLSHATADELDRWRSLMPAFEPEIRQHIAKTLVETAEADVHLEFAPLFDSLLDDDDHIVRSAAIDGLWESTAPRLIPRFVAMLKGDSAAKVRARAGAALGAFIERAELGLISADRIAPTIVALVDAFEDEGEDVDVRRRSLESLGYSGESVVSPLIEAGVRSNEAELRAGALRAMGHSADEKWSEDVLLGLDDDDAELRFEAARAAGELALREATPLLARLASEEDHELRMEAIWALGEIGGGSARGILERLAKEALDEDEVDAIDEALATVALGEGDMDYWSNPLGDDQDLDPDLDDDWDE